MVNNPHEQRRFPCCIPFSMPSTLKALPVEKTDVFHYEQETHEHRTGYFIRVTPDFPL
jgi:hypothetical protein